MSEFIKQLLPAQDDFVFSTKKHPAIIGGLGSCLLWLLFISHFLTTETFPYPSVLVASQANLSFFILYVFALSSFHIPPRMVCVC